MSRNNRPKLAIEYLQQQKYKELSKKARASSRKARAGNILRQVHCIPSKSIKMTVSAYQQAEQTLRNFC
jgi:hypothetical protein